MHYDPKAHGARCDLCPLAEDRMGPPVPPEWPSTKPRALLVAERPGADEVKARAPLVGRAGQELMACLGAVGVKRPEVALSSAILCRPPDDNLDRVLHQIQKVNKQRMLGGVDPIPTPMACCLPRLRREIARCTNVVALGKVPYQSITGRNTSITEARGGPIEFRVDRPEEWGVPFEFSVKLLPAFNPAHVIRFRRWRGPLRSDLGRAFRWFEEGLNWTSPVPITAPRPAKLREFLDGIRGVFSVFDVETSPGFPDQGHYDACYDRLRCLGIGTADGRAIVIPFRSVETGEGVRTWYTMEEFKEIVSLVKEYLYSPAWPKGGWNSRVYDALVLKHYFGDYPKPNIDGIPLHRVAEPEMKHNLGLVGSIYTDVDKWKAGHTATTAPSDNELWQYNATDTVVTAKVIPQLVEVAKKRQMVEQAKTFAKLMDVCRDLHVNGIRVDQEKRREWDAKLLVQARAHRDRVRALSKMPNLNPGSFLQLADLLFEKLKIAPYSYSEKTGEPSTGDDALRAFLSSTWGLPTETKQLIGAIRDFRRATKRRGVVVRLRPIDEPYFEAPELIEEDETDREDGIETKTKKRSKQAKQKERACGLVLKDGRVHADWNSHGTTGWRFSSSGPNMQNLENILRDMFVASPGNVLVGCDEAQLELRMVAGMARSAYYLEAFNSGADPHFALCLDVFGVGFKDLPKDQQKKLRVIVKALTYAGLYGAEDETKHEIVTAAEDEKEQLIFPDLTMRQVAAFTNAWHRRAPEIKRWWESLLMTYRRQGYLTEPVMGLRLDFLDGEDPNKMYNYPAQSGGAAMVHRAMFRFLNEVPFFKWGPGTGLIQQAHDSLVVEVPEAEGERVKKLLEEAMTEHGGKFGLDLPFIGEAKVGHNLKEV